MRNRRREFAAFSLFSFQDIITSVMGIVILILLATALELASRQLDSPAVQHAAVRDDLRDAIVMAEARLTQLQRALKAGGWDDLARLSSSDIDRESLALEQLVPTLERDLTAALHRLQQVQQRHRRAAAQLEARRPDEEQLDLLRQELAAIERELARISSSSALFYRPSRASGKRAWMVEVSGEKILAAPLGPVQPAISFPGSTPQSRERQMLTWANERNPSADYFVVLIKPGGAEVGNDLQKELRAQGFGVGLDLIGAEQTAVDPERGAPLNANTPGGGL